MKRILCFGDSNTYGYRPDGLGRYDETIRWTGRVQEILGRDEYTVIEEGLCGRTTVFEDEIRPNRKGIDAIRMIIETHNPIDIVIIMLGTNDCKTRYGASAGTIARGTEQIIEQVRQFAGNQTRIVILSPIHLAKGVGEDGFDPEFDEKSVEVSLQLSKQLKRIALSNNCSFLDASTVAEPSTKDREHLDEEGHEQLANLVVTRVKELVEGFYYGII
ncbi:SGNH/GDSL hydrolase family protein [Anaerosporobacter sp.]|uniref:SGNH/GDSL hydrolase family protein n=1 Tax=Anaerosporobacter sp. TaxID=1872529 RepID=UPI00286FAC9E|nr:SGNH/GDSL hydrolase family protein [Anaerosporobacter sp.]